MTCQHNWVPVKTGTWKSTQVAAAAHKKYCAKCGVEPVDTEAPLRRWCIRSRYDDSKVIHIAYEMARSEYSARDMYGVGAGEIIMHIWLA